MSSNVLRTTRAAASAVLLGLSALAWAQPALAQSDEVDPEVRIQQLENQLRQLTGQNEELQYRNRQLEERLRLLQGAAQGGQQAALPGQPGAPPPANGTALPPVQPVQQAPGGFQQQGGPPAPIAQEGPRGGRR